MAEAVCLDASVVLKLVLPEPGSEKAVQLVDGVLMNHGGLIGPAFLLAEALSVLRGKVLRGLMAPEDAEEAVGYLLSLPLMEVSGPEVYRKAWEIGSRLEMPVIYDAVYLAVAELQGVAFWTADEALYKRARNTGFIRLLTA